MRFHYGAVPENKDFLPEADGWRGIREPGPIAVQILAIPVAIGLLLVWAFFLFLVLPKNTFSSLIPIQISISIKYLFESLMLLILLIPLHEFIHAFVTPGWGLSSNTVIGLWVSKLLFYAHYEGKMSRNHFLVVFVTPYIVLGLLPFVFMAIFPELTPHLALLSLFGSILASGDVLGAGVVVFQIPGSAIIRNKGWKTYWKPAP